MTRIDFIWLTTELMDIRAGTATALAMVIAVFGTTQPHCAYLFANRRANRTKVLVHDELAVHQLNQVATVLIAKLMSGTHPLVQRQAHKPFWSHCLA